MKLALVHYTFNVGDYVNTSCLLYAICDIILWTSFKFIFIGVCVTENAHSNDLDYCYLEKLDHWKVAVDRNPFNSK